MTTTSLAMPARVASSAAETLPRAEDHPTPNGVARGFLLPVADAVNVVTWRVRPASPCADHTPDDARDGSVGATPCDRQAHSGSHVHGAVAQLNGSHLADETRRGIAAVELLYCAAFLDDIEKVRIATENRLRSLTAEGLDAAIYAHQAQALADLEHQAVLALKRAIRAHPLGPWIKLTKGIGEKQGARLIAAIGDISYNHAAGRPRRGPAELSAYCGYDPAQKRRKGVKSNWNAQAKMRAFLVAESCIKQRTSPYRAVYDRARANWVDRDTSDGHKHNHALRLVAKAVLRDLFIEARKVGA